jgi:hypothetical protein
MMIKDAWWRIWLNDPNERLVREIRRRANVVGMLTGTVRG